MYKHYEFLLEVITIAAAFNDADNDALVNRLERFSEFLEPYEEIDDDGTDSTLTPDLMADAFTYYDMLYYDVERQATVKRLITELLHELEDYEFRAKQREDRFPGLGL